MLKEMIQVLILTPISTFFVCSAACPAGYYGINCNDVCSGPYYGLGCNQKCDCFPCHHIYGCIMTPNSTGRDHIIIGYQYKVRVMWIFHTAKCSIL